MVMLLEGRNLQFFVYKKLDPSILNLEFLMQLESAVNDNIHLYCVYEKLTSHNFLFIYKAFIFKCLYIDQIIKAFNLS